MVNYHVHDGDARIAEAEETARRHAGDERVLSFASRERHVVGVGDCQLVMDLRRGRYDVRVDADAVGKYTDWDAARSKFERLLRRRGGD